MFILCKVNDFCEDIINRFFIFWQVLKIFNPANAQSPQDFNMNNPV
jgi:hypothetical protein